MATTFPLLHHRTSLSNALYPPHEAVDFVERRVNWGSLSVKVACVDTGCSGCVLVQNCRLWSASWGDGHSNCIPDVVDCTNRTVTEEKKIELRCKGDNSDTSGGFHALGTWAFDSLSTEWEEQGRRERKDVEIGGVRRWDGMRWGMR